MAQMTKLTNGQAQLTDAALTIEGMAPDLNVQNAINASLAGALPGGIRVENANIRSPVISPYPWSAQRQATGIMLSGFVPDDKTKADIAELAGRRFPGARIIDSQQIGAGAPRNFFPAAAVALEQVSRLTQGGASLSDTQMTVEGETPLEKAAEQIRTNVSNALPPGFLGTARINVSVQQTDWSAAECQSTFTSILAQGQILFRTAEAVIERDSWGLLDSLAIAVKRCPSARVEIAGHTDSDGAADRNQALSERRAKAVVEYLIDVGGIPDARLDAVGYGQTKPVAPNDTRDNKAKNRRITFDVK